MNTRPTDKPFGLFDRPASVSDDSLFDLHNPGMYAAFVAEACAVNGPLEALWTCEELLLASGRADEAYTRYGLRANQGGTYLATFRALAKRYPTKKPADILQDMARSTPGQEGKWFAAAKEAGLLKEALALVRQSPCDPRTLTRAALDFAEKEPAFAAVAGLLAIRWLLEGHGYEVKDWDVEDSYKAAMAAERNGTVKAGQGADPGDGGNTEAPEPRHNHAEAVLGSMA